MDEDEAMRAFFPVSFGKKTKSSLFSPAAAHSATRRTTPNSSAPSSSKSWPATPGSPKLGSRSRHPDEEEAATGSQQEEEDSPMIGPPRPPEFEPEREPEEIIGPPRPQIHPDITDSDSDDDSEGDFGGLPDDAFQLPLSNEIVLRGHSRVCFFFFFPFSFEVDLSFLIRLNGSQVVSALAIDHSGSRVLSGSFDYTVRMYDFQGMTSKLQSFRQLEPSEGHQVRSLSWSPTSDKFLCVTGSAQAKV